MSFLSLYRKYRPENFSDIVGQEYVIKTLKNALKNDRIAHAYLFAGPRGTGKTSTAKVFAKSLNCKDNSSYEPCGVCENCQKISSGQSLDVIEIDAASNRGIDEIRDLREKVKFYPSEGNYKVYIIDEVHMLTKGAFNALLKTLEEPPENVVFILATTEPHQVISTILSRCQRFDFSLLSIADIEKRLSYICEKEKVDYEEDALNLIAHSSNGGMRDAISILDQAISYTNANITANELRKMLGKIEKSVLSDYIKYISENDTASALELINDLLEKGKGISRFISDLIEHLRQLLLVKECGVNNDLIEYPPSRLKLLKGESEILESTKLVSVLDILTSIEKDIKFTNQPRLVLEMGIVKMTSPESDDSIEGLKSRVAQLEYELKQLKSSAPNSKNNQNVDKDRNDKVSYENNNEEKIIKKDNHNNDNSNKEKVKKKIKDSSTKDDITLKEVQNAWPVILKQLRQEDIKTNAYLKEGKVIKTEANTIFIEFPKNKKFHRNGAAKNSSLITKIVSRVLSKNCRLEFVVKGMYNNDKNISQHNQENSQEKKEISDDKLIDSVMEMFDGEIIEAEDDILED
ncbi:MAG: DNA polymerase III subunit gamma/tau [Bacillota bacterium]